jgi:hypothetical protein
VNCAVVLPPGVEAQVIDGQAVGEGDGSEEVAMPIKKSTRMSNLRYLASCFNRWMALQ